MKSKFKIGDKVRVISDYVGVYHVGQILILKELHTYSMYWEIKNPRLGIGIPESHIRLTTKLDRVL